VPNIDQQTLRRSLRGLTESHDDDIGAAIERTVRACVDLFGVDGSGLMVADEQNTLRYVTSSDEAGRILEEVQSETGHGPCVDTFVYGEPVSSSDLAGEQRWPDSIRTLAEHGVRAVLGIPVHVGGVVVGSLNVYLRRPHVWDRSEREALAEYSKLIEAMLRAALTAQSATELAEQLQYALDNRVLIERAVGFVMATAELDAVGAFDVIRRAARGSRRKVADVAHEVLDTRRLPAAL
jgi:GAF domain-containing protein